VTDETKLMQAASRATRAKILVEDELFREAFRALEEDYTKALIATEAHEQRKRESLWQAIQILGNVRDHFASILRDGKLAKAELDELANKKRPKAA
jgi:hypothetical protein